jgi:hypothetical protein
MSLRLRVLNAFFRAIAKPRLRRMNDPVKARREFAFAARWCLARGRGSLRTWTQGAVPMLRFDPPGGPSQRAVL